MRWRCVARLVPVLGAGVQAALFSQQPLQPPSHFQKLAHTYSIVAWDSASGDLGVAVQSKFPNVGGIVPWARAGVGAIATQSLTNLAYGERGLELLAEGATADEALRIIMQTDTMLQDRQVGIVDARARRLRADIDRRRSGRGRRDGGGGFGWEGPVDHGTWLRRPGQHHGVGSDGQQHGGDL
jgi:hypothetical protein